MLLLLLLLLFLVNAAVVVVFIQCCCCCCFHSMLLLFLFTANVVSFRNTKRTAEVWLDSYKKFFYAARPSAKGKSAQMGE